MGVPILIFFYFAVAVVSRLLSKFNSNTVPGGDRTKYAMYFLISALAACVSFVCFSGFSINLNLPTVIYGIIFAVMAFISLLSGLHIYRYATVAVVNIFISCIGMVLTPIIAALFFSEELDLIKIIRICIVIVSSVLIYFDTRTKNGVDTVKVKGGGSILKSGTFMLIFLLAAQIFVNQGTSVITKMFASDTSVTDENSFLFVTNLILAVGAAVVITVDLVTKKTTVKDTLAIISPKNLVLWSGSTLLSAISSLLTLVIISQMDVMVFNPLTSALTIVASLGCSFILKEKMSVYAYIAAAVACVAIII
jgi:drug/metabolite transporter (DMT)-like permease